MNPEELGKTVCIIRRRCLIFVLVFQRACSFDVHVVSGLESAAVTGRLEKSPRRPAVVAQDRACLSLP